MKAHPKSVNKLDALGNYFLEKKKTPLCFAQRGFQ